MNCCAECFGDRGLRRNIFPFLSTRTGKCSYCGTGHVAVVQPRKLAEYFELLVSAYRRDPEGKLLVQWFRQDWALFGHPRMNDRFAKELLAEIFDDGEIVRKRFVPVNNPTIDRVGEWEKLRDELRFRNRYFPEETIDLARLRELLSLLTLDADELPTQWYRSRIQTGDKRFAAGEMSAPPKEIASHGRANPAGIPYLYLASSPVAAVSEVRPHTGEVACIASFAILRGVKLKVVDLRAPRRIVSPFLLEPSDIGRIRNDLPFLERLGEELTRPVLPQAAAIDYAPSQYLCEFIKKCGYHGVVYRSSVSDGINLALFDPELARCGAVDQYDVDQVKVEISARKL